MSSSSTRLRKRPPLRNLSSNVQHNLRKRSSVSRDTYRDENLAEISADCIFPLPKKNTFPRQGSSGIHVIPQSDIQSVRALDRRRNHQNDSHSLLEIDLEVEKVEVLPAYVGRELEVIQGLYGKLKTYSALNKQLARAQEKSAQNLTSFRVEQARLKVSRAQCRALKNEYGRMRNMLISHGVVPQSQAQVILKKHSMFWHSPQQTPDLSQQAALQQAQSTIEAQLQQCSKLKRTVKSLRKESTRLTTEVASLKRMKVMSEQSIKDLQESLVKANTASLSKNTGRDSHEKELDSARRHQQEKNRLEVRLKEAESSLESLQRHEQSLKSELTRKAKAERARRLAAEERLQEEISTREELQELKEEQENQLEQEARVQQRLLEEQAQLFSTINQSEKAEREALERCKKLRGKTLQLQNYIKELKRQHRTDLTNIQRLMAVQQNE